MKDKQFKYFLEANMKQDNATLVFSGAVIKNKLGEYLFEVKSRIHKEKYDSLSLFGDVCEKAETGKACLKRVLLEKLQFDIERQGCKIKLLGYNESVNNIYHAIYMIEGVDDSRFKFSKKYLNIFKIKDLDKLDIHNKSIEENDIKFAIKILVNIKREEANLDKWNNIKKKTLYHSITLFKEREVWWVRLGQNIGFEQNGKGDDFMRPVLILQKHNQHTALVLPMTSKDKSKSRFHAPVKYNGRVYYVSFSQSRVISSKRLIRRIYKISEKKFAWILNEFILHLKTRHT